VGGSGEGTVGQIWRYPVSSIGGELLRAAELSSSGIAGDRNWCLVDPATGEVAAPERRRRWRAAPQLLARNRGEPELRFANGSWLPALGEESRRALAEHFGFPVEVRPAAAADGPPDPGSVSPRYRRTPIHLLTTGSLRALRRLIPDSAVDPRRFRPNLVIETQRDGFIEQDWIGREFTIGSAHIRVLEPCSRCAFTVIAQQGLEADPVILNRIVGAADGVMGVLCSVTLPGPIRTGDELLPVPAPAD
jgi:uncharacterized protein